MRIRNLSGSVVRTELWRELAEHFGLGQTLPLRSHPQWQRVYKHLTNRTLTLTINRRSKRNMKDGPVTSARYSFGRISLFPCPRCTTAFLTHSFLHGLSRAWLDQYHEDLTLRTDLDAFFDEFADRTFAILGGKRPSDMKCWKCKLPKVIGRSRIRNLKAFAERFRNADSTTVDRLIDESSRRAGTPINGDSVPHNR